ncbi:MAG: hypothetical protein ACK5K7_00240 [Bacilli bacterium]
MKWGKKKASTTSNTSRTKSKSNTKLNAKDMSDDELRKVINRMQMEKQYSQLTGSDVSSGKAFAQKLMKAGTTVAAVSTTGLTIYNNADKIQKIIKQTSN